MKRLYSILIALLTALICVCGIDFYVKKQIDCYIDRAICYNDVYVRNQTDYVMDRIIDEDSAVVLGTSELFASDDLAYPPSLYNQGYSDFKMILMGAGTLQSLAQAINVGALDNNIKNDKVVLIVSPQWFTEEHLSPDAFGSRFQEANYVEFLRNENISKATKAAVATRVDDLLVSDPSTRTRVHKYEDIYLYHSLNPVKRIEMGTYSVFISAKHRFESLRAIMKLEPDIDYDHYVKAADIDFESLLPSAIKLGEQECTNNEYGIYDDYYDTYIRAVYEDSRNSQKDDSYLTSVEYDDFRLFLDVCRETGIDPLIINVPVNGRWYDYTGFPREDREQYYQNINDICAEYGVSVADFSDREYEMYFLKDISHMGWKGWVYLDEAVYEFYKGESRD